MYPLSNVDKPLQSTEHEEPKMDHVHDSDELLEVEEQLLPYIARTKDAAQILDMDGMYFIDSRTSINSCLYLCTTPISTSFVLRLCDKLNDYPTVEYYVERAVGGSRNQGKGVGGYMI